MADADAACWKSLSSCFDSVRRKKPASTAKAIRHFRPRTRQHDCSKYVEGAEVPRGSRHYVIEIRSRELVRLPISTTRRQSVRRPEFNPENDYDRRLHRPRRADGSREDEGTQCPQCTAKIRG